MTVPKVGIFFDFNPQSQVNYWIWIQIGHGKLLNLVKFLQLLVQIGNYEYINMKSSAADRDY